MLLNSLSEVLVGATVIESDELALNWGALHGDSAKLPHRCIFFLYLTAGVYFAGVCYVIILYGINFPGGVGDDFVFFSAISALIRILIFDIFTTMVRNPPSTP